jgi:hypothetical protein
MQRTTKPRATSLAELSRTTHGRTAPQVGSLAALRESHEREELRALYVGMVPTGRRTALGAQRWRFDDTAAGKRNLCADLVADARSALRRAGANRAQVLAPFERMLAIMRAECGLAAGDLPPVEALDLAETVEQGAADVAVKTYALAPAERPEEKASLGARAIQTVNDHLSALTRLRDRLRQDHVLVLHALRTGNARPRIARD